MSEEQEDKSISELVDKPKDNDGWTEVKGIETWLPNEGEILQGVVISIQDGAYGPQWMVEKEGGECVFTPSHKVLQTRLCNVAVGSEVRIVAKAKKPTTKGNDMQLYKVWTK